DVFDTREIQELAWVKRTAKDGVLHGFSWDVGLKYSDAGIDNPSASSASYGRITLTAGPFERGMAFFFSRSGVQELSATVDLEDVHQLQRELERLREALIALKTKEGQTDSAR